MIRFIFSYFIFLFSSFVFAISYQTQTLKNSSESYECISNLDNQWSFYRLEGNSNCQEKSNVNWFNGEPFGVPLWYSKTVDGDIQCLSFDGKNCTWQPDYKKRVELNYDENNHKLEELNQLLSRYNQIEVDLNQKSSNQIRLPNIAKQGQRIIITARSSTLNEVIFPTGTRLSLDKGSRLSFLYLGYGWYPEYANLNHFSDFSMALPLVCGQHHKAVWGYSGYTKQGHWCQKLKNISETYNQKVLKSTVKDIQTDIKNIDQNITNIRQEMFDQISGYTNRLETLRKNRDKKRTDQILTCSLSWWNLPGIIACSVLSTQYNDLNATYLALIEERKLALRSVKQKDSLIKEKNWWLFLSEKIEENTSHLSALLQEQKNTLDELNSLIIRDSREEEKAHRKYLESVENDAHDMNVGNILLKSLEDTPLIGRELTHIMDYAQHPSETNLRRMLLGLFGPVGEAIDGSIEIMTDNSSLTHQKLNFLNQALSDLSHDSSLNEALEDIVEDIIHDLGDEAIEGIREAGLWDEGQNISKVTQLQYQSLIDLRSQLTPVGYDFWQGTTEVEKRVQSKFRSSVRSKIAPFKTHKQEKRISSIFRHAFGDEYDHVSSSSSQDMNHALLQVINNVAYAEERQAYWADSSIIGARPAGLIFDYQHAFIVLNKDLVSYDSGDIAKFYFEELGHLVNWWRCKIYDVSLHRCQVAGDAGARFRDAVMLDDSLYTSSITELLTQLPVHAEVATETLGFDNGHFATLEGWPSYYTINDHIAGNGTFSWLMRLGLDITSEELGFLSDEFDVEISVSAPTPAMKGNPWEKSKRGYCETDFDSDCNMPTMWMSISFRDAIKISGAKVPRFKDSRVSQLGFDLSPRLVRKHGGKMPFQLTSVRGTNWKYFYDHNIYAKKLTAGLETKLDLWKMAHSLTKNRVSKIHKPEVSFKATPMSGSYLVEIAARDKQDFATWLAADVSASIAGCAAGFAIGVVAEIDPIVLCHAGSDLTEIVESTIQGLDKRPTMFFEADGNVTLPSSLEYKYATSGAKLAPKSDGYSAGRVKYDSDSDSTTSWFTDDISESSISNAPQVMRVRNKVQNVFSKLAKTSLSPVMVFRFRVGFNYSETLLNAGDYGLPSAIVVD
ncbi:hypothetical protein VIBC2010_12324 [Vibrio caribbeanicus ATCC BAA-2122]|uniref:Uncharacterized protein n=1 Tax=Vibrio caribbeanicus ATCC BAA-2122 TaxID=796620 RepID=E3BL08_9VIBR|nr:hypothetical protein VIBC2010_12324 [Vibrio caribbeanicus ATCC BAA-2122]